MTHPTTFDLGPGLLPITGWAVFGETLTDPRGFVLFGASADEAEAAHLFAEAKGAECYPIVNTESVIVTDLDSTEDDVLDVAHALHTPEAEGDPELVTLLPGGITEADRNRALRIAESSALGLATRTETLHGILELLGEVAGRVADVNNVRRMDVIA